MMEWAETEAVRPFTYDGERWTWKRCLEDFSGTQRQAGFAADLFQSETGARAVLLTGCWEYQMPTWPEGKMLERVVTGPDADLLQGALDDEDTGRARAILDRHWTTVQTWEQGVTRGA